MSELSINTTQNVAINFNAASVGDRILGYVLDIIVKAAYGIFIYFIFFYWLEIDNLIAGDDFWSQRALQVLFYLPVAFYSLAFESLFEGQTVGKRIMKIKVIKIDGYQAGFGDYFIRWLMRLIDISISMGLIGLISMLVSKKIQRLGDMAAGTAVISLKNNISINHTILQEIENDYVPTYPLVIKLSDNDMRIIKETFESSLRAADFVMISKLQQKVEAVTGIKSISSNATAFVDTIIKDYNYYTQKM
jgi:uncharacterized RDD family membrane protein YckC